MKYQVGVQESLRAIVDIQKGQLASGSSTRASWISSTQPSCPLFIQIPLTQIRGVTRAPAQLSGGSARPPVGSQYLHGRVPLRLILQRRSGAWPSLVLRQLWYFSSRTDGES